MKKRFLYIILVFSIIISCKNINENKNEPEKVIKDNSTKKIEPKKEIDTVSNLIKEQKKINSNTIKKLTATKNINFNENKKGLKLKFSEITKNDFQNFKKEYSNKITIDSSQIRIKDSSLTLLANEKEIELKSTYEDRVYYQGFIKSLNSYILTNCKIQYCGIFLLNKDSNKTTLIYSPFDNACKPPLISKSGNQMIFFSNSMAQESFISKYVKNKNTEEFDFINFDSFYTENWTINEIAWINDNAIALKVSDNKNKDLYLKAIIE